MKSILVAASALSTGIIFWPTPRLPSPPPVVTVMQVATPIIPQSQVSLVMPPRPKLKPLWLPQATTQERSYLSCVKTSETGNHYLWGWNPFGTGNGGGAYQFEPGTWAEATAAAGVAITDHSPVAQDKAALALLRMSGTSPWVLDYKCTHLMS